MIWKGKEIVTYGDDIEAMQNLASREEAQEFMRLGMAENQNFAHNIGYMTGYFDQETMARLLDWCDTSHPVFGKRTEISASDAFEAGKAFGGKERK